MARCASCGSTVVLGGARDGELRYCNGLCKRHGPMDLAERTVPDELLQRWVASVHQGPCRVCERTDRGVVDLHESFRVWSLGWTFWSTRQQLSCRRCGQLERGFDLLISVFLGWWGFPLGPIMAPIQIVRNVMGLVRPPRPHPPSEKLYQLGREILGEQRAAGVAAGVVPVSR